MKTNLKLIGGKRLQSPNNLYTRPTTLRVREAIFNILNNKVENSKYTIVGFNLIKVESLKNIVRPPKTKIKIDVIKSVVEILFKYM